MSVADRVRTKMGVKTPPKPAKEEKPAKESRPRQCCGTMSGKGPHAADCPIIQPTSKKKMKKWAGNSLIVIGWRWPDGTVISKTWTGVAWECVVTTPGGWTWTGSGKNAFGVEREAALKFVEAHPKPVDATPASA